MNQASSTESVAVAGINYLSLSKPYKKLQQRTLAIVLYGTQHASAEASKEQRACNSQKQKCSAVTQEWWSYKQMQLNCWEKHTSRKNSPLLSLTTVAVSPAALDPLPEVYTEMGAYRAINASEHAQID